MLFVSALIPKAFASIMTSIILELSKPENVSSETVIIHLFSRIVNFHQARWKEYTNDDSVLDNIVLEAQRLWPPFLGGRRVCKKVGASL